MSTWFTTDNGGLADERLLAAWRDAPVENQEVCGFILEAARDQVIAYAPALVPTTYEPVTLTWANGWTLDLTRVGDVVTGVLSSSGTASVATALPIPVPFQMLGSVRATEYNSLTSPTATLLINDVPATGDLGAVHQGAAPAGVVLMARWLGDPAPGDGVPARWAYAQLQQAKNLLVAGSVGSGGGLGEGEFTYEPRPLDKAIKNLIRPIDGKPDAY